jgi:hypothetical protein
MDWDNACQQAFITAPVLVMPNTTQPFRVETDASGYATRAVLSQQDKEGKWHPCAFLSQSMAPAERNYDIYDKELLAIIRALEEWRHYLEGADLSQIFAFSLYLSWSHAGVYPDARPAPIILPDALLRPDGGDAPLPLMLSLNVLDLPRRF